MRASIRGLAIGLALGWLASVSAQTPTNVLNPASDLAGKTLVTAEGNRTISGTFTWSVPVRFSTGTSGTPGIVSSADQTTGFQMSLGSIAASLSGTQRLLLDATGLSIYGVLDIDNTGLVTFAGIPSTALGSSGTANATSFLRGDRTWQPVGVTNSTFDARLSLTSNQPVTIGDVTAAGICYLTPYHGSDISLYDGTLWANYPLTQLSYSLSSLVNEQGYDVFVYLVGSTPTLEVDEWAHATITMTIAAPGIVTWTAHGMSTGNSITFTTTGALPTGITANVAYWITVIDANTFKLSTSPANVAAGTFVTTTGSQSGVQTGHQPQARQTNLVLQDGVLALSGSTTRRYAGSFLTTSSSTTEDSLLHRNLFNNYNRVPRRLRVQDATDSWTYTLAAYREANNSGANQTEVFIGYADTSIWLHADALASNGGGGVPVSTAIGEDSTSTAMNTLTGMGDIASDLLANQGGLHAFLDAYSPAIGRHFYAWLERSAASATTTWYGDNGDGTGFQFGLQGYTVQ